MHLQLSLDSIVDSRSAFKAGDPGSIPGVYYFCWGQDFHLKVSSRNWRSLMLEKKLFSWKKNCPNRHYISWTMNIQKIKNYWDIEIIGNRRKMVIIYVLQVLLDYSKPWHHGREIISKVAIICCSRFSWEVFSISGQVIVEQIFCKYLVKTLGFRAISKWVSNVCVCIPNPGL